MTEKLTEKELLNKEEEIYQEIEKDLEKNTEEIKKEKEEKINPELAKYYGKNKIDINELLSAESKAKRFKDRLDYIKGDLTFENEEDIPPYLKGFKDFKIENVEHIEDIIKQIEDSINPKHLEENIIISKLPVKENKLKKVNDKLNGKIYQYNSLRGNEEIDASYINLFEIYESLLEASDEENNFKEKNLLFKFVCALGIYMSQFYEKYPYYIKTLSENIEYIGKYGNKLNQNEEFIKVINNILRKFKK